MSILSGITGWLRNHAILDNHTLPTHASDTSTPQTASNFLQGRAQTAVQPQAQAQLSFPSHGSAFTSYSQWAATQPAGPSVAYPPASTATVATLALGAYQGAPNPANSASSPPTASNSASSLQTTSSNPNLSPRARSFLTAAKDLAVSIGLIAVGLLGCEFSETICDGIADFGETIGEGLKKCFETLHQCVTSCFTNPIMGSNAGDLARPQSTGVPAQ